ncbi:MAG: methyltransferase domain-containing protein [Patescibacteria group bacterium]
MLRKFIELNRAMSLRFDKLLPSSVTLDGLDMLKERVRSSSELHADTVIHDYGGGKHPYAGWYLPKPKGSRMHGFDIDKSELDLAKPGLYDKIHVSDISVSQKPVSDKADISFCIATLEHVPDSQVALANVKQNMKTGSKLFLFIPNKNAAFSRLNILLPETFKKKLLSALYPDSGERLGFKANYDRCTPRQVEEMCQQLEFSGLEIIPSYNSFYFTFFTPLHMVWRLLQVPLKLFFGRNMCETFVVIAKN